MFFGRQKPAMWDMLRDCRLVNSSIQAVQTWSNVNRSMLIVTQKREPLFFEYLWNTDKNKVGHVAEACWF